MFDSKKSVTQFKFLFFFLFLPLFAFGWKMEVGQIDLPATSVGSSVWQSVTLQQSYTVPPLVFVLPNEGSGYNGDVPASVRVRNIDMQSFEIVQVEAQGSGNNGDGAHPAVNVHYLAIEPGVHTLPDGTSIIAGALNTASGVGKNDGKSDIWVNVNFSTAFSTTPVVLAFIQDTANESHSLPGDDSAPWMTTAVRNVTTGSFNLSIDRAETSTGSVTSNETIAYLAIEGGRSGNLCFLNPTNNANYETIVTSTNITGWDNTCSSVNFSSTYAAARIIGSMQTRNGGDGGWLRRCNLGSTSVGVTVDEDRASDNERSHTAEIAGLWVFSNDFAFDSDDVRDCSLVVEYRFDACGYDQSAEDVQDNTLNGLHGTSQIGVSITPGAVCKAMTFDGSSGYVEVAHDNTLDLGSGYSVAFWLYMTADTGTLVGKIDLANKQGWDFEVYTSGYVDFDQNGWNTYVRSASALTQNAWHHVVGVYDPSQTNELRLYIDGAFSNSANADSVLVNASSESLYIGHGGSAGWDNHYNGNIDEVKIFNRVLSPTEVNQVYVNESAGRNWDEATDVRGCNTCTCSSPAGKLTLSSIPADLRNMNSGNTVDDLLGDDFATAGLSFGSNWAIAKRTYNIATNSASYVYPTLSDVMTFGDAYWIRNFSSVDVNWSAHVKSMDFDITVTNYPDCQSKNGKCVLIDLIEPNGTDTGSPYFYNMTSIPVLKPVYWSDVRVLIDGTAYTIQDANELGRTINTTIWWYDPGSGGYATVTPGTPGAGAQIVPCNGYIIELDKNTAGKRVQLLVPQE